jgi:hypothetical protein
MRADMMIAGDRLFLFCIYMLSLLDFLQRRWEKHIAEPIGKPISVVWRRYSFHQFILNVDGSSRPGVKALTVGGIIRKGDGEFIFPIARNIDFCDSYMVELKAIMLGLVHCLSLGLLKVVVQSDSELLVRDLTNS